jgi:hypothetical protein
MPTLRLCKINEDPFGRVKGESSNCPTASAIFDGWESFIYFDYNNSSRDGRCLINALQDRHEMTIEKVTEVRLVKRRGGHKKAPRFRARL